MPIIRDIRKDGYEFVFEQNPVVTSSMQDQGRALASTSSENPIVLVVRRKGVSTLLLKREGQLIRASSRRSANGVLDLLNVKGRELPGTVRYEDVSIEVSHQPIEHKWIVGYSVPHDSDGVIVNNEVLYEAPREGYERRVVITGPPFPKYLYLRSRSPAIYTRLELEHSVWRQPDKTEDLRVNYNALVNPYGTRSLEYESGLEKLYQLRMQLEEVAREALLEGRRPGEPDLQALMSEARKATGRDDGGARGR